MIHYVNEHTNNGKVATVHHQTSIAHLLKSYNV